MSDRFFHVTTPSLYRDGLPGESEDAFTDRLAAEVETLIRALGPDTVAAFVAEPVQGAGGVVVPPKDYFRKIRPILKKYDVLMVADEVICGFGRTGNMWGCDTFGIEPDLLTCAKQLSSAYLPIAALLMSDPFYEVIADYSAKMGMLGTGFTYGGHPVSAAVANETLKIYEEDRVIEHVQEVAPHFQARLERLGDHELVGEARGVGLIGAIEIVADKATGESFGADQKVGQIVAQRCLAHGVILRNMPGDIVGICPPLIITKSEIDMMFDGIEAALADSLGVVAKAA